MNETGHRDKIVRVIIAIILLSVETNVLGIPSSVDNAALLYYQAMMVKPERDIETNIIIKKVLGGIEPNEVIRAYLKKCERTLKLVENAAEIENCNWGMLYSPGRILEISVNSDFDELRDIIGLHAMTLCADKEYKQSLDWSFIMLKISRHIDNDTIVRNSWSLSFEAIALVCIKRVFESMPQDAENLKWLKDRLEISRPSHDIVKLMKNERNIDIQLVLNNQEYVKLWRKKLTDVMEQADRASQEINEQLNNITHKKNDIREYQEMLSLSDLDIKKILGLNDDELKIFRNLLSTNEQIKNLSNFMSMKDEKLTEYVFSFYDQWVNSGIRILNRDIPYQQKCLELREADTKINELVLFNSVITGLIPYDIVGIYSSHMKREAVYNISIVALELYIIKANTGKLPNVLPKDAPNDPFNERPFNYNTTNDGFELSCQEDDLNTLKVEFMVDRGF